MLDTLRPIIVALLTVTFIAGLSWLTGRAKPLALSDQAGSIRPGRGTAWFTVVGGIAMFALGAGAAILSDGGWSGVFLALMGAASAGFMAPSLTSIHTVNWNADEIEGPSNLFGPTLGSKRTAIKWADIVKVGGTFTGYDYVEARDGRRVYWSYLYNGHAALTAAIEDHCPWLADTE
jgi:hypothetical protein